MVKVILFVQNSIGEHRIVWKAAGALALGVALGVLVAAPYDLALGSSMPPYTAQVFTALQSLIATATLVCVRTVDRAELEIDAEALSFGK